MNAIRKVTLFFKSLPEAAWNAFDVRDFFFLIGVALFGYGLWLFVPWIGFSSSGVVLMATAYLMKDKS